MKKNLSSIPSILKKIYTALLQEYGPQGWWPVNGRYFPEHEDIFEIIVGAILTQNTSWKNAEVALQNLRKKKMLDPDKIIKSNTDELRTILKPSGYYNQKAKRLKEVSTFYLQLKEAPKREDLLRVNGIGPETADSILLYAFHVPVFVVDAYTKRIAVRTGLIEESAVYTDIQYLFRQSLHPDEKLYNEYHALIVKHGKDICRKKPLCAICILRKKNICSYSG